MGAKSETEPTSIQVSKRLKSRLDELKPYPSMSYQDLIRDMAENYAEDGGGRREL